MKKTLSELFLDTGAKGGCEKYQQLEKPPINFFEIFRRGD